MAEFQDSSLVTYVCFDCAKIHLEFCKSSKQFKALVNKCTTGNKCIECSGSRFYFHDQFKQTIDVGTSIKK